MTKVTIQTLKNTSSTKSIHVNIYSIICTYS